MVLLQKEFPLLKSYQLPSYNIRYSKKGVNLKFKLLFSIPSIIKAVKKEQKIVAKLIEKEAIVGIISDNRFGVFSKKVPSVYITHQLHVLSGITTGITSKIHQKIIQKFDECWVPDIKSEHNYSGKLGHLKKQPFTIKYIGVLSRFKQQKLAIKYNLLVLLSGPEPQRTLLENKLLNELKMYKKKILFVRGILNNEAKIKAPNPIKVVDYLLSSELETAINESEIIVARSGYSTIMDLAVLGKKAFFIPTPGQFEQEYLAKILREKWITPFVTQNNFKVDNLKELTSFSGFNVQKMSIDLNIFNLFKRK